MMFRNEKDLWEYYFSITYWSFEAMGPQVIEGNSVSQLHYEGGCRAFLVSEDKLASSNLLTEARLLVFFLHQ